MDEELRSVVTALTGQARRGDVLPTYLWLDGARGAKRWTVRGYVAWAVGPEVPSAILDRLCELMPDASEPRLLRAAAVIRRGGPREIVEHDLAIAAQAAPADPTPGEMLAYLAA